MASMITTAPVITKNMYMRIMLWHVALGGLVVSVLATGPKVCGFKLANDDTFLKAIKTHSTPSLEGK
jgi:hypothetical protein